MPRSDTEYGNPRPLDVELKESEKLSGRWNREWFAEMDRRRGEQVKGVNWQWGFRPHARKKGK